MLRSVRALLVGLLLSSVVLVVAFVVPADAAVKKTSSLTVKVSGAPKRYPAMITVTAKNFVRQVTKTATLKNLAPGTYTLKVAAIYSPTGKWVSKPPRKVTVKTGASSVVVVSYQKVASVGSLAVSLKSGPQGKPVKVTVLGPKGFKKTLTKSSVINSLQPGQYSVSGDDIDLKENLTAIAVSSDPTPMVLAGEKSKVVVNWNSRQASNLVIPPQGSLVSQKVIAGVGEFETSAVKAYRVGDPVLLPATQTERERVVIVSSISGNTVSVNPGSVYDALPVVDFKYISALSPDLQQNMFSAQVTAQGEREFTFFSQKIKAEWGCENASKPVEINMKTTYTPILEVVDAKLNWNVKSRDIILGPSAAKAVIRTGVTREMSLEISSKLSVECRATLKASVLAFTLGPIPFYVRGSIGLAASIESSPLTVEVGQTDTFSVDWGVDYSRGSDLKSIWEPYKDSDMSIDKLGTWSLDTKVEGKAGIEVDIELSPFKEPFEWKAEGCVDLKFKEVCQTFFATSADLAIGVSGKIGVGLRMIPKTNQDVGGSVATFGFQKFWYASVSAYLKAEASLTVGVTVPFAIQPSIKIYDKDFEPIGAEFFRTYTFNGGSSPIGGSPTTTTVSPRTTTTTVAPVTTTTVSPGVAPVAVADVSTGSSDTNIIFDPLSNDSFSASHPAVKSSLKLCSIAPREMPNSCTRTSLVVAEEGTYTVNVNGTVTFDPLPLFTGVATPVTYIVADSSGRYVSATITPTIAGCSASSSCVVGATGPGGGKVFYVASSNFTSAGSACGSACRYLEVAPIDWYLSAAPAGQTDCLFPGTSTSDPRCLWSGNTSDAIGSTGAAIGTGYANTSAMIAQSGFAGKAGTVARAFRGGGKTDWSLPSKNELNEMAIQRLTVGFTSDWYWSSTEYDGVYVWRQYIVDGTQLTWGKGFAFAVRPVRAF